MPRIPAGSVGQDAGHASRSVRGDLSPNVVIPPAPRRVHRFPRLSRDVGDAPADRGIEEIGPQPSSGSGRSVRKSPAALAVPAIRGVRTGSSRSATPPAHRIAGQGTGLASRVGGMRRHPPGGRWTGPSGSRSSAGRADGTRRGPGPLGKQAVPGARRDRPGPCSPTRASARALPARCRPALSSVVTIPDGTDRPHRTRSSRAGATSAAARAMRTNETGAIPIRARGGRGEIDLVSVPSPARSPEARAGNGPAREDGQRDRP